MRKVLLVSVIGLVGGVALLLAAALFYREELVRFGVGRFLDGGQLTLTRVEGLQVTSTELRAAELEFLLHESAQRLVVTGLDVDFRVTSYKSAPVVESVTVSAAQLLANTAVPQGTVPAQDAGADADEEPLLLSNMLTLLREFPLDNLAIDSLTVPQRSVPLALQLQRSDGELKLQAESGALRLQLGFAQTDAAAAATLQVALTRNGETAGNFYVSLTPAEATYQLAGAGLLQIDDLNALLGEFEQAPLPVPLRAADLEWDLAGTVADDVAGFSEPATFLVGLQQGSSIVLPAGLAEGLGDLTLTFSDRMELSVATGAGAGISTGMLPLQVDGQWRGAPFNVDARLAVDDCRTAADAACTISFDGNASYAEYALSGVVDVNAPDLGSGLEGDYHVRTQNLMLTGLPAWLPQLDVAADVSLGEEQVTFSTPLLLRGTPADAGITADGQYDLATGRATLHANLPELVFVEQGRPLSAWFSNWDQPFDLLTGAAALAVEVERQADATIVANVNATLSDTGGFYNDIFFRGVNGALQATLDTAAEFPIDTPPLMLSVASIDVGLPIDNVAFAFRLDRASQQLQLESAYGEVLGGNVTAANAVYDFDAERNDLLVRFSGLRIERMLDQIEYKGVEAAGAVSGEIPITITPDGVVVEAGKLQADAPGGSIRYVAPIAAGGNPGLDLINQALGNYQFESLVSGIDYKPDGELLLSMQLQGTNPDMRNGQRINLNLNLSDDIPALLESLQAARRIEEFLAEQYQ